MRKLTYYIATSFDGFVSRPDGRIDDFSFEGEHVDDLLSEYPETIPTHLRPHLNVTDQKRRFDTVLMGRKTYEVGLELGVTNPYQHLRQYVFSKSLKQQPAADVNIVTANALDTVRGLKAENGLGIWLCGGPVLASALLTEIDDLVIKVNPFLMGAGRPLFASSCSRQNLRLVDRRDYANGFSLVHFEVDQQVSQSE